MGLSLPRLPKTRLRLFRRPGVVGEVDLRIPSSPQGKPPLSCDGSAGASFGSRGAGTILGRDLDLSGQGHPVAVNVGPGDAAAAHGIREETLGG